jgi:hypothetical protein
MAFGGVATGNMNPMEAGAWKRVHQR